MKTIVYILLLVVSIISCSNMEKKTLKIPIESNSIECTDNNCFGTYIGREFIEGADIAHQFSNKMSYVVGNKLKEFYRNSDYKKVDFSGISMSTKGMGTGYVAYKLSVPFVKVSLKCDAYTSFDHVGGWNHKPNLSRRRKELKGVLFTGHKLNISELKRTAEGLQEYWIQWKNKETQSDCK